MSELRRKLVLARLPPPPPTSSSKKFSGGPRKRDYSPISWRAFFDKRAEVKVQPNNVFCTYEKGSSGPIVVCLHGGGFSALTWALFSAELHKRVQCICFTIDLRGHGESVTSDDTDLSAETLASDVGKIVTEVYGDDPPPIVLMGHSMGGSVAIHVASSHMLPSLAALVVIDVVEGSAMDALCGMKTFLRSRPKKFTSVEHAIEWSIRSGQLRNVESARVSMTGQIRRADETHAVSAELNTLSAAASDSVVDPLPAVLSECIAEEEGCVAMAIEGTSSAGVDCATLSSRCLTVDGNTPRLRPPGGGPSRTSQEHGEFVWRIKLEDTEQFWEGWFKGMSKAFLTVAAPKLLLLAGIDRLDKELTIGQMQGKFQMQVLPRVGHAVHEDSPDAVADALASFMVRHRIAESTEEFSNGRVVHPGC